MQPWFTLKIKLGCWITRPTAQKEVVAHSPPVAFPSKSDCGLLGLPFATPSCHPQHDRFYKTTQGRGKKHSCWCKPPGLLCKGPTKKICKFRNPPNLVCMFEGPPSKFIGSWGWNSQTDTSISMWAVFLTTSRVYSTCKQGSSPHGFPST